MGLSERYASSLDTIAGHAEQVCSVAEGTRPPPGVERERIKRDTLKTATIETSVQSRLISNPNGIEAVSSSWQRSVKIYGVDPIDSQAPRILTSTELKDFREPLDELIFSAQEEMDQLYEVVREAGYAVLLSVLDQFELSISLTTIPSTVSIFKWFGTI
jgi:transcriptional regulator of acetoin/glycerol metabolism